MEVMRVKTIRVDVPDELMEAESEQKTAERMRELYVLDLLHRNRVTRSHAAHLLGIHLIDLAHLMTNHGLYYYDKPDAADIARDEQALEAIRQELNHPQA